MPSAETNPLLLGGLRSQVCYRVFPLYCGVRRDWLFYVTSNGQASRLDVPLDRGDRPVAPAQIAWFQKRHGRAPGVARQVAGDSWELSGKEALSGLHARLLRVGFLQSWDFMTTGRSRVSQEVLSLSSTMRCELDCMWGMEYLPGLEADRTHFCKIHLEGDPSGRYRITCVVYRKRATKVHPSEWFQGLFSEEVPCTVQTEFPAYRPVARYEIGLEGCLAAAEAIACLPPDMFSWFRGRCVFRAGV